MFTTANHGMSTPQGDLHLQQIGQPYSSVTKVVMEVDDAVQPAENMDNVHTSQVEGDRQMEGMQVVEVVDSSWWRSTRSNSDTYKPYFAEAVDLTIMLYKASEEVSLAEGTSSPQKASSIEGHEFKKGTYLCELQVAWSVGEVAKMKLYGAVGEDGMTCNTVKWLRSHQVGACLVCACLNCKLL